jgi:hypothetical protein
MLPTNPILVFTSSTFKTRIVAVAVNRGHKTTRCLFGFAWGDFGLVLTGSFIFLLMIIAHMITNENLSRH